jgi:beta-lactamase class D
MKYLLLIAAFLLIFSCSKNTDEQITEEKRIAIDNLDLEIPEVESIFEKYEYNGSFVMLDLKTNEKKYYNKERCSERFSPASTFKIPNSLIALETGVASGKDFTLKWDGIKRHYPDWNRDHNLNSAIKFSVVWYYQELARRIGADRMKEYINKIDYGNNNISGNIDEFWLNDTLKISQEEQVEFLTKLYKNELPLSEKTMNTVKEIMLRDDTENYKIHAKTGTADKVGWYVGWVETKDNAYIFALNLERKEPFEKFMSDRIKISEEVLKHYGVIQ